MIKNIKFLSILVTVLLPILMVLTLSEGLTFMFYVSTILTIGWATICVVLSFEQNG